MKRAFSALLILLGLFSASAIAFADFPDVPKDHYNYTAINYVQAEGIVSGHPDGTYKPEDKIDRAAFTKIMIESQYTPQEIDACGSADFKDVPDGIWYDKYVCMAQKNKVVDGYPDGTFGGEKLINLAEASKIISNAFGYEVQPDPVTWYKPYVEQLTQRGAIPITTIGFDHQLTRGEMAEIIYRLLTGIYFKSSLNYSQLDRSLVATEEQKIKYATEDQLVVYNHLMIGLQKEGMAAHKSYIVFFDSNVDYNNFEEIEVKRIETIEVFKELINKAEAMGDYKGDSDFVNALVNDLNFRITVYNKEAVAALETYIELSQNQSNLTQEELDVYIASINDSIDAFVTKIYDSNQVVLKAHIDFAAKNGIELNGPDSTAAFDYAKKLLDLYDEAFEKYALYVQFAEDSFNNGDLVGLEKKREETLAQIKGIKTSVAAIGDYKEDRTLLEPIDDSIDVLIGLLNNEEKELIDLWTKFKENPESISNADLETENTLLNAIVEKTNIIESTVDASYEFFAIRYDIIR